MIVPAGAVVLVVRRFKTGTITNVVSLAIDDVQRIHQRALVARRRYTRQTFAVADNGKRQPTVASYAACFALWPRNSLHKNTQDVERVTSEAEQERLGRVAW